MAEPRTLKITRPPMRGRDVEGWQRELMRRFEFWDVDYPLVIDGIYGQGTRSATATVLHGLGIAQDELSRGVTPWLRVKVRDSRLSDEERARYEGRADWRRALKRKHEGGGVAPPLAKILDSRNGYSSWHDGVDLICPRDAPGFAICKARVVRADGGGWWGKGAPRSFSVRSKGDGITVIRSLVDIGPIRRGMNFGYGHAESPRVKVGQVVEAGDWICRAGMANAPHFHFMVNTRSDNRGVGDRDPMPYVRYAQEHS